MASRFGSVIVFARAPQYGRGKRRLAAEIGDLAAHRFYRRQLAATVRVAASEAGWRAFFAIDPQSRVARPSPPFSCGRAGRLPRRAQAGRDLGRRMTAALRMAPPGPVVLIGADIPGVTAGHLRRALRACRSADVVFGPAEDGGFWLVGTRRRLPLGAFDGVAWSTENTLRQVIHKLPHPARVRQVDMLKDVDNATDLPLTP